MKVVFSIPALTGNLQVRCHQSLVSTYRLLTQAGIEYDEHFIENCPYLPVARATLVAMFMADPQATDLFFVDSDVAFDPTAVQKILDRPEGVVAGIYPLKRDFPHGYPVELTTEDGKPIGKRIGGPREYLVEANFLPTGFMRCKRIVFEALAKAYPELRYEKSVVEVMGAGITEAYDFFGMGAFSQKFRTEDFAFCQRWRDIGGHLWVMPDITFQHIGPKAYAGNLQQYLLRCPGGELDPHRPQINKAISIPGLISESEVLWLAREAKNRKRVLEIGSFYGRSTRALADNTTGEVWAVDDWNGPRDLDIDVDYGDIYAQFCANLKDHIASGRVHPVRLDFANLQSWIAESALPLFDMVFIDGDHLGGAVRRDIELALKHTLPGALICGHDYNWPEVREVVDELLPEARPTEGALWAYEVKEKTDERASENAAPAGRQAASCA